MSTKPAGRPRTLSRVAAVQALYQAEQSELSGETVIDQFVRHRIGVVPGRGGLEEGHLQEADVPLFARIVRTATMQQDVIDGMIVQALPESWPALLNGADRILVPSRFNVELCARSGCRASAPAPASPQFDSMVVSWMGTLKRVKPMLNSFNKRRLISQVSLMSLVVITSTTWRVGVYGRGI